jgi:hypothetical protein
MFLSEIADVHVLLSEIVAVVSVSIAQRLS